MRTLDAITADLAQFSLSADSFPKLNSLGDEIERHPQGENLIEPVLRLFERYSGEDFGAPGPLAHAVEQFYGRGYEARLIDSLRRSPTKLTIWLAHRIINVNGSKSPIFVEELRRIAKRGDIDPAIALAASEFTKK